MLKVKSHLQAEYVCPPNANNEDCTLFLTKLTLSYITKPVK